MALLAAGGLAENCYDDPPYYTCYCQDSYWARLAAGRLAEHRAA